MGIGRQKSLKGRIDRDAQRWQRLSSPGHAHKGKKDEREGSYIAVLSPFSSSSGEIEVGEGGRREEKKKGRSFLSEKINAVQLP